MNVAKKAIKSIGKKNERRGDKANEKLENMEMEDKVKVMEKIAKIKKRLRW